MEIPEQGHPRKTRALNDANRQTYDQDAKAWREEDTDHALPDAEVALTCLRKFDDRVKSFQGNLEELKEKAEENPDSIQPKGKVEKLELRIASMPRKATAVHLAFLCGDRPEVLALGTKLPNPHGHLPIPHLTL